MSSPVTEWRPVRGAMGSARVHSPHLSGKHDGSVSLPEGTEAIDQCLACLSLCVIVQAAIHRADLSVHLRTFGPR